MIVVGGEALVDLVPVASPDQAGTTALADLSPRLGGGPYNVAIALALLDTRVAFLSRVSEDAFGRALVDRLDSSGVDLSLLQRGQEPTTLAVVGLGEDGSARYSFYVEGTADRMVADPGPLPAGTRAVCLGTLGMVLEPGASRYEALLRRESARGTLVALDPNIRAEMIGDAAAYRRRFLGWLPDVGLLKLSVEDAAWLAGVELGADLEEGLPAVVAAAREWRAAG
uniref:PfkB family carbohydrate kinase n=1 Tax=Actinoalloteichus spitiensis TaxID=252394 RepID=UPI00036C049D